MKKNTQNFFSNEKIQKNKKMKMIEEEIDELLHILKESFVYEADIIENIHPSININYKPIQLGQTINSSNEHTNKQITRGQVILAGAVVAGILATSTYVMSKDEYVKFHLSKIDSKFKSLKELTNDEIPSNILQLYDGWKSLYVNRTSMKCQAKIVGSSSMITSVGGFVFFNNLILFGGIAGSTICGCYLLWKYLSDQKSILRKEQTYHNQLCNSLEIYQRNLKAYLDILPPSYYS